MAITQETHWDDVGIEPGAGDAEYTAGQQPISEHDNWFNWSAAKDVENLIAALENVATGHDHDGVNSKQVGGSDVVNIPAGNISSTNSQAALNELDTEKSLIANITDMDEQSFTNLLENGDVESWSAGAAAAPDGWTYGQNGAGGGVARIADTKIATYLSRLTKSDALRSSLYLDIPFYTRYKSRTVTLGCWVKSANTTADAVWIRIDDGVDNTSEYYQNSGDWEWITVTRNIDSSANKLRPTLTINTTADSTVDFVGAIIVEGLVCPAFSPKPIINSDLKFRDIASVAVNTTLADSHYTVGVDASGAARTITLPAAASNTGRIYNISKRDASANTVTIDANAAELINGAATVIISAQYGSYTIQSDGTGWWVI